MVDGKCPHCGSSEIYVSDNPFYEAFMVKTEAGTDLFSVQCYLCLSCRAMELHAAERSPSLFGKNKALIHEVPKSANWKKVA